MEDKKREEQERRRRGDGGNNMGLVGWCSRVTPRPGNIIRDEQTLRIRGSLGTLNVKIRGSL